MIAHAIVQTHQKSLDRMGKKTTTEQIKKAIEICHNNGIMAYGSFIIGYPGETEKDVKEMIEFTRDIGLDIMQPNAIIPFPSTPLFDEAVEKGWMRGNEEWWEDWKFKAIMDTDELTHERIQELTEYAMERFYYNFNWMFGLSKWKRMLSDRFKWWWKIGPKFLAKGSTQFFFKLGAA